MRRAKALLRELAPDYRADNDPWGHAMEAFFDVAAELHHRGVTAPAEWQYRPAPGGPDISDTAEEVFADLYPSDEELLHLGHFLHRLTARLDRAGRSY